MNLDAAREKYRAMRRAANPGSGKEFTCTKILICLDNARNEQEAREYLTEEIKNTADEFRKNLCQEALEDLN